MGKRKQPKGDAFVTIQLKKTASGGKVCHLESRLRMRFAPRSSGQITSAFQTNFGLDHRLGHLPIYITLVPWSAALLCGTGNDGLKSRTGVRRSVSVDFSQFFLKVAAQTSFKKTY